MEDFVEAHFLLLCINSIMGLRMVWFEGLGDVLGKALECFEV